MSDPLSIVFLQCLIAGSGIVLLLFRQQTAYMGITCLFAFQVCSASLSGFFFGRLYGLSEAWITPAHEQVLTYSGWMCIAIIAAMWLAWWPRAPKRDEKKQRLRREAFAWVTPDFVFLALALGAASSLAVPFLFGIPTIGTAVSLLASWLKLGLIGAVILYKKHGYLRPLVIATVIYVPLALVWALRSGHTPLSLDAIIPIALVSSCLNRVNIRSFLKLLCWMIPAVYLMFGWMASRSVIRSGELDQFSLMARANRFAEVFADNLLGLKVTRYDVQSLLFDRIDMSDLLAEEVDFESSPSGDDEFRYGGTIVDGLYSIIPRAIWPDKPIVAGYANFVSRYTGMVRDESDVTSIGVPIQFELYANGGSLWVIGGVFVLFWLCARFERFVAYYDRSLHILMPSVMLLMCFATGIEQIMLVVATGIAGAGAVFLVAKVIEIFFPQLFPQFDVARIRYRLAAITH